MGIRKTLRWCSDWKRGGERWREAQFLWSVAQVLLWQLEPARQPAMLCHLILCLCFFSSIPLCWSLYFSLSLWPAFVSLWPFVREPFSPAFFFSILGILPRPPHTYLMFFWHFFFLSFPWTHTLQSSLKLCWPPAVSIPLSFLCRLTWE